VLTHSGLYECFFVILALVPNIGLSAKENSATFPFTFINQVYSQSIKERVHFSPVFSVISPCIAMSNILFGSSNVYRHYEVARQQVWPEKICAF